MSSKIGRNDPCWCGSGKKYKHCHYRRDKDKPATQQELADALKKKMRRSECLHPNAPGGCGGNIIKAHTIQKNGGLSSIARNGHVYTPEVSMGFRDKQVVNMKLQGINKASTITGFCKYHDNQLFAPIEDYDLKPSEEQALLLAFRAISRELYAKRIAKQIIPYSKTLDKGKPIRDQVEMQSALSLYELGTARSLENLEIYKKEMDSALTARNFEEVSYYAIQLDKVPDILCSGSFYPTYDSYGNQLQDLLLIIRDGGLADLLAFSLLRNDKGGIALFSWLGKQSANLAFISSLNKMPDFQITHALFRLTVEYFENIYLSPDWWEGLDNMQQQSILYRWQKTIEATGYHEADCLVDDGERLVNWKVVDRLTNVSF